MYTIEHKLKLAIKRDSDSDSQDESQDSDEDQDPMFSLGTNFMPIVAEDGRGSLMSVSQFGSDSTSIRDSVIDDLKVKVSKSSNYVHYFLHYEVDNYDHILGKAINLLEKKQMPNLFG